MIHFKKNYKKNNRIRVTKAAAAFLTLAIIMVVVSAGAVNNNNNNTAIATTRSTSFIDQSGDLSEEPKAPMAASEDGNNVYVVWWTNRSGNWEVMFRASNDGGATFGDKINLSNSSDADSWNAEILASGDNVYVSWWETSAETGSSESVLRASTDGGETFGPVLLLGTNGTIGDTGEEEGEGEGA